MGLRYWRVPRRLAVLIVVLGVAVWSLSMAAQSRDKKVPAKPASSSALPANPDQTTETPQLTAEDLGSFFDGLIPQGLSREDIAGAAIVVVKDGKILFSKGYGYSNVANKTPVSPETTLFRPGSVSKLITWTAVMQQVERGKLDLDRDVNDYLDFRIPPTYSKPITLRNLMTHTAGFEEALLQLWVKDAGSLKSNGEYLKERLPRRIYAPGTVPSYSNYGTTLAGYLVERVSGQRFEDYVDENIFKPLGMAHSTFRQPLPDLLKPLSPIGYRLASGPPHGFEFIQTVPAGASSVTPNDMARFMIAHLQDGRYEGSQILRSETAQLMHSRQSENHPQMNAMALGFFEESRNGHRIIGHTGETQYFQSVLHLIPDAGVGVFYTQNSPGKGEIVLRNIVWDRFLNRYFPHSRPSVASPAGSARDMHEIVGNYISSRSAQATIYSVFSTLSSWNVVANDDGTVSVSAMKEPSGQLKRFQEIGPLFFRNVNGEDRLAFKRDGTGRLVMIVDAPFMIFQKEPWFRNAGFNLFLIIGSISVFVLTILLWPVAALVRWHYGIPLSLNPQQNCVRMLTRLVCAFDLLFLLGFALVFQHMLGDYSRLSPQIFPLLHLIQFVGYLGALGTLVVLYNSVKSWTERGRWLWSKVGESAIALASLGFVWFVFTGHMLNWNLNF